MPRLLTAVLGLGALVLAGCGGRHEGAHLRSGHAAASSAVRPTEPFRREHVELAKHLAHVHDMNGRLASEEAPERADTMRKIVSFFEDHLAPHARWEEGHLYTSVDKRAGGPSPFTASMRFEHRVVERWIGELRRESLAAAPDVTKFARRTDYLLGLVTAHLEAEEEVLLPVLDRTMTPQEFERELGHDEGGVHSHE